jgi:hypothetical protein
LSIPALDVVSMPLPSRHSVFISYCHADRVWLDRLLVFLKPFTRQGTLEI